MAMARRIGFALALATTLGLTGCASTMREWDAAFVSVPARHHHAAGTPRHAAAAEDPGATASTTSMEAPAAPESVLEACKRHLYLDTATSTDEVRVTEAACKDIIVNQPIGGGN